MDPIGSSSSKIMFNYDEYTRYLNNLNCMYHRVDRRAEVTSTIRDYGKGHRGHSLSIYIAGVGQHLSEDEQQVVRNLSEYCSSHHQDAWIVMDLSLDQIYQSQVLPRDWIASILPHILEPGEYIADQFLYASIDTCNTICRECRVTEEIAVSNRHMQLLDELLVLYEQGSIVGKSDQFNVSWELEQDERGIWHPSWWNTLLTEGDPTLYLSKRANQEASGRSELMSHASSLSSYREEAGNIYLRLEAMDE